MEATLCARCADKAYQVTRPAMCMACRHVIYEGIHPWSRRVLRNFLQKL